MVEWLKLVRLLYFQNGCNRHGGIHQTRSNVSARFAPELDRLGLPPDYRWTVGGEVEASERANEALFRYMPQCLIVIVLLLVWQFNSFRRTAVIVLTIPLIVIGASLGLNLTGAKLDFNALLGLLSLAGIIVNNAIVRIDEEREGGRDLAEALVVASRARFRPILMTTLTTIAGLIPLYLLGGELWRGMTVVMMFGLGIGTILTLGVVPVLYSLFFDTRLDPARIFRGSSHAAP